MRHYRPTAYGVPALTARQAQVLCAISDCQREYQRAPTIREIGEALEIRSNNGVNDHLKALERKGYLERGDHQARALVLLRDMHGKPLVSREDEVAKLRARIAQLEAELEQYREAEPMRLGA